jgi:hypothetical protein
MARNTVDDAVVGEGAASVITTTNAILVQKSNYFVKAIYKFVNTYQYHRCMISLHNTFV